MKKYLLLLFLLLTTIGYSITGGNTVSLQWDANVEPDVAGYIIYYGTNSGGYFSSVDVGNTTTTTIGNLKEGLTYFFVATAYNTSRLESGYSNEVSYEVPITNTNKPSRVPNVKIEL
jgi:hypothetical protein